MPSHYVNTLRPRRNRRHFPDDIFKCIFFNEDVWISIKISLNFVPMGPVNNIPALVQIMAWRQAGDNPLSEPMLVRSLTHICVTRPQWVKQWWPVKGCIYYMLILSELTHLCITQFQWVKSSIDAPRGQRPWNLFQYKDLSMYKNSHYKHKTVARLSYSYNGNLYTCKTAFLCWNPV